MQRPVISLLVCLLLAGCGNTPGGRTYRVSHTGGVADFTPSCQSISIDTSRGGHFLLNATSTELIDIETAYATTVTAQCRDAAGQATGNTVAQVSGATVYLGSSENNSQSAAYAQTHTVQGIFPIVVEKSAE